MNNLLKSIFIALFPLFALYILVDSVIPLFQNNITYRYIGRIIIALSIIIFFANLFIISQARTSRNLILYTFAIILGLLISFLLGGNIENHEKTSTILSLALVISWFVYLKWYSVFDNRETSILKEGAILQSFELEDSNSEKVRSIRFFGKPTIYLFYRGNWCPLCMAQIKEIAAQYKELKDRGVNMVFVSPQPHKFSENLAKKYDLGFTFLTDTKNKVAKQLGIFAKNGIPAGFQLMGYDSDTVLPTVIITDSRGKIIFVDLTDNYRVRPEPETFLRVIDDI
jgi:peroxiredoxin